MNLYSWSRLTKFSLQKLSEPSFVGPFDAAVIVCDKRSVKFFEKQGFTSDLILNEKFKGAIELTPILNISKSHTKSFGQTSFNYNNRMNINEKRYIQMTFIPAFDTISLHKAGLERSDCLKKINQEINSWKERSIEAHQSYLILTLRMQQEIQKLYCELEASEKTVTKLERENTMLKELLVH